MRKFYLLLKQSICCEERAESLCPLTIDGILDEKVWQEEGYSEFIQTDPIDGAPPSEKTQVWIAALLGKQFIKLVLIANIIAWPIAFFMMNQWLQNFAYRLGVKIWVFLLSAFVALAVALMTVSYQSIKAALANPIDSLRYE